MSADLVARMVEAYQSEGPVVELGRAMLGPQTFPEAVIGVPVSMCNRHGLIAGATGTGKTKTLQLMAEQLSDAGVAVFMADMKGDLTGLARPGTSGRSMDRRIEALGIEWEPGAYEVDFLALGGLGPGVPVRATVSSFGPQLLAKVIGANETQASSLTLVFRYADEKGLGLLDLDDLRDVLRFLDSDDGRDDLKSVGGLSSATVGVLLRKIVELEEMGAQEFFGEPELDPLDLVRNHADGRGVISCVELAEVADRPRLFSTFLMWLLAELFEELPEVGDLDRPKLVFFFDEAHLLFADASEAFVEQVAMTVRLIRSKGVGVFFVTQLPDDLPPEVLAQLGNRVQHALRAFTPRDARALKAAVTTYPHSDDYDLAQDLTRLGIGEAMVTILTERGTPTPVAWTLLRPPRSSMAAVAVDEVAAMAEASDLWERYSQDVDRPSAREILAERIRAASDANPPEPTPSPTPTPTPAVPKPSPKPSPKRSGKGSDNAVVGYLRSPQGRSMINSVARGVFGLLKKRR